MSATQHYSIGLERNHEGWWPGRCCCGWYGGMFPDAEDAADALMDHAYQQGRLETVSPGEQDERT